MEKADAQHGGPAQRPTSRSARSSGASHNRRTLLTLERRLASGELARLASADRHRGRGVGAGSDPPQGYKSSSSAGPERLPRPVPARRVGGVRVGARRPRRWALRPVGRSHASPARAPAGRPPAHAGRRTSAARHTPGVHLRLKMAHPAGVITWDRGRSPARCRRRAVVRLMPARR